MNTKNFKCFQTVYEERNLQKAAGKLFLSPQGLSKIIKSLEDEVGTPLFIRSKEGLIPTESGKVFYEKSKLLNRDLNDLFASIDALNSREARFQIGFSSGTLRALDVSVIRKIMAEHSEIVASWHERSNDTVMKQVLHNEVGFGFVIGQPSHQELKCCKIKSIDVVLYVYREHPLWDAGEVDLTAIKEEPLISMNENYHIYHDVIAACQMNGFHPNIIAKVSEGESIYQLVKNQIGIGISPRFFPDNEEVRAIPIRDAYTWDIYGIYRCDAPDLEVIEKFLRIYKVNKQ